MGRILAVLALAIALAACTPYEPGSQYTGVNRDFLVKIHSHGDATWGSDDKSIKLAHDMCDLRGQGYSPDALTHAITLHNQNISDGAVRFFVDTATAAYCPELG